MPPFVQGGPHFPTDLLELHEHGRVVLFCGAGVSMGAGPPCFGSLVDLVYENLREDREGGEARAYERKEHDRVLDMLEGRLIPGVVRQEVRSLLAAKVDAPLDAHQDLIDLAGEKDGKIRLITTNFDDLFERAGAGPVHTAPQLPLAHNWQGVVHLHGSLLSGTESNWVLTSSDFGAAYLTDGWASRFLTELFREYAVLFVGYSLADPVVRYLTDAMRSHIQQGRSFKPNWVMAGVGDGAQETTDKAKWSQFAAQPIFYSTTAQHRSLYDSLNVWARLHKGGLKARAAWAIEKIRTLLRSLTTAVLAWSRGRSPNPLALLPGPGLIGGPVKRPPKIR